MDEAGADGSTPTPQKVLDVLQNVSKRCKIRLPQVTPEIEALAHKLALLTVPKEELALGYQVLSGLQQATQGVAAYLPMLVGKIAKSPPILEPGQAKLMDDYRTFRRALRFWHRVAETELIQRAQLAANDPLVLKQRKDLAVLQTNVFASVQPVLEQAGIHTQGSASPTSIVCRATAALINRFTDDRTTAQAVSSEARRQLKRQREAQTD